MRRMQFVLIAFLWMVSIAGSQGAAQAWEETGEKLLPPVSLVVLKPGESKLAQLCWDDGLGRAPVLFLFSAENPIDKDFRRNFDGRAKLEQAGVTAELDEQQAGVAQAALYDSGKYTGPVPEGNYRHVTCVAVRVAAAKDTQPSVQSMFISVVSGTGRSMLLTGEFRVVVLKP